MWLLICTAGCSKFCSFLLPIWAWRSFFAVEQYKALLGELNFGGSAEVHVGIKFVLLLAEEEEDKASQMLGLKRKEKPVLKEKENFMFSKTKPLKVLLGWCYALGNWQTHHRKYFFSPKSDFKFLRVASLATLKVFFRELQILEDNVEFVHHGWEFAARLVCLTSSLITAGASFLIETQGLPFVMKKIIHDCHAVPKALNALVVRSSNIYITKINCLPNYKTKRWSGT